MPYIHPPGLSGSGRFCQNVFLCLPLLVRTNEPSGFLNSTRSTTKLNTPSRGYSKLSTTTFLMPSDLPLPLPLRLFSHRPSRSSHSKTSRLFANNNSRLTRSRTPPPSRSSKSYHVPFSTSIFNEPFVPKRSSLGRE